MRMVAVSPRFVLFLLALVAFVASGSGLPLRDVHWDSPIYLYQAKRFADTPYLHDYSANAAAIAGQVDHHWPRDENYSEAYWRFSRLGHVMLVGTVVALFGATQKSILLLHWLFSLLLSGAVLLAGLGAMRLLALLRNAGQGAQLGWAIVVSAALFMSSGIFVYLAHSLVSEVPALFLLSVAALLLVMAMQGRSFLLAALSGLAAFAVYVVRMESIWVYLSFAIVLAAALYLSGQRRSLPGVMSVAGGSALFCYLLYAWYFYPLADPRLFLTYEKDISVVPRTVSAFHDLGAAGGLLWIGVVISVLSFRRWPVSRLALGWAALILLPAVPYLVRGAPIQARMLSTLVLPFLIASACGWGYVWAQRRARTSGRLLLGAGITSGALLMALSWSVVYDSVVKIPMLWRAQYVRQVISPPRYEEHSYYYDELNRISAAVYDGARPGYLLSDPSVSQEDLNLVRFFGPPYERSMTLVRRGDPTNAKPCATAKGDAVEPVVYCTGLPVDSHARARAEDVPIFYLTRGRKRSSSRGAIPARYRAEPSLLTAHFQLLRLHPAS